MARPSAPARSSWPARTSGRGAPAGAPRPGRGGAVFGAPPGGGGGRGRAGPPGPGGAGRGPAGALDMRRRRAGLEPDRRTLVLGGLATAALAAVGAVEFGRVWRRGDAPLPLETGDVLGAAETAAVQTAAVARAGYRETPPRESALFNLLSSFAGTFLAAHGTTYLLRRRRTVGPFRNLTIGRRRIHHFVPGILLGFAAGGGAVGGRPPTPA